MDGEERRAGSRVELIAAVVCGVVLSESGVSAQSFTYRPLTGTLNVPFIMDTSANQTPPLVPAANRPNTAPQAEFVGDAWGNIFPNPSVMGGDNVPWATQRIAANLRQRYRILGNPYLRQAAIRFENFAMNTTPSDLVTLGWFYSTPAQLPGNPALPNGHWGFPVTTTVYGSGANSLTWPGMLFHVITGPDIAHTSLPGTPDTESWGFETSRIEVAGTGVQGDTLVPTLGLYDSAIVVLMGIDDVVRTVVANTGHPITVAMWAPSAPGLVNVSARIWARCGAAPTATMSDTDAQMAAPGFAIIQMNPCPGGQAMHLAVTNGWGQARAVRLYVGSNKADREYNLKIGIDFAATPTEMETIRQRFRRAAWMFYGLSGGTQIIRSYRFYNNANTCDWAPLTACSNQNCNACVVYSPGATAQCNGVEGRMRLYLHNNEHTIAHEMGHCFTRNGGIDYVRDEYDPNGNVSCGHTWMGGYGNNAMTLCTDASHGRTGANHVLSRSQAWVNQTATASWGYYYSAGLGGGGGFGGPPTQDSGWRWMNGRIPAAYPSYQTPEVLWMERFWGSGIIGRFDQLQ